MWKCSKCNEQHADHFSSCWKCAGMDAPPRSVQVASLPSMTCVRCETDLDFVGTKRFQEDSPGGIWGAFGELFAKRERFDVYACPRCGRVEFFVDGVGEEYRAEAPAPRIPRTAESAVERMYNEAAELAARGEAEEAVARFELVITRFPGTNYARKSEEKIRTLTVKLGIQPGRP